MVFATMPSVFPSGAASLCICICVFIDLLILSSAFAFDATNKNHAAGNNRMLQRKDLIGLWRLTTSTGSSLPKMGGTELAPAWMSNDGSNSDNGDGILLMLRDDGSFVQYGAAAESSERQSSRRRGNRPLHREDQLLRVFQGSWNFDGKELILASDRPVPDDSENDTGQQHLLQVHDTIFSGEVSVAQINEAPADDVLPTELLDDAENKSDKLVARQDVFVSVQGGSIGIGKFMYPKDHPSFFEKPNAPIFQPQQIGEFDLRQMMGVLNAFNTEQDRKNEMQAKPKFQPADFYGKKFLLTSEPIQMKRAKPKLKWSKRAGTYVEENGVAEIIDQQPFDLRVMPIRFFQNNTFCAIGSGKILRGRFGLEGPAKDKLWFAVSLFGAGRSAPGSVYSEGPGLSHEDRRSYLGDIVLWERSKVNEDEGRNRSVEEGAENTCRDTGIFVEGAITVGLDMGTDARAIPVARFTMREALLDTTEYKESYSVFELKKKRIT